MKVILFCGHLSKFGEAFLKTTLASPKLQIDTIVLAKVERWMTFTAKLKRIKQLPNQSAYNRNYLRKTKAILQYIKINAPQSKVLFVEDANEKVIRDDLKSYSVVLTAAFPQIFSTEFLASTPSGAINFHPSYLPRCRGAHPVYWTIASREDFGGVSSHFMTNKIDQGPIIAKEKILFEKYSITYDALYEMVLIALPKVVEKTIDFLKEHKPNIPVEETLMPTYFRENQPSDHRINWDIDDMEVISAKIRAGNAFCTLANTQQKILLYPPVSFQLTEKKTNSGAFIICQERQILYIETKNGILSTKFKMEYSTLRNFVSRVIKKIHMVLLFEKLERQLLK